MRLLIVTLPLMLFSACSSANDRVDQYLEIMEASLNTSSLLYKRLSPEVAEQIKPVEMPKEARAVAECVVNSVKKENQIALFDESMKQNRAFMNYIVNTEELTLLTLEQDQEFAKIQSEMNSSKYEPFVRISKDCGAIKMNMQLTQSTGVFEAMKLMREMGN